MVVEHIYWRVITSVEQFHFYVERSKTTGSLLVGLWRLDGGKLVSPKQFGARLELPYSPPPEYKLSLIAEPVRIQPRRIPYPNAVSSDPYF